MRSPLVKLKNENYLIYTLIPIASLGPTGPELSVAIAACSSTFGSITKSPYGFPGWFGVVQKVSLYGAMDRAWENRDVTPSFH